MSYSLGDTADWARWYAQPTEVYVWRADVANANIQTPEDARLFLRAVAKAQKLSLDARAITVLHAADDPTRSRIDVVLTADSFIPYAVPSTAKVVADRARVDGPLTARFPNVQFIGQSFLQLVAPPDAVDFWKAHPVIWDDQTGPLQAFAELKGIYKGRIDDGPRVISWTVKPPPLNGKKPGKFTLPKEDTINVLAWAAAGAAVAWLGAQLIFPKETQA